MSFPALDLATFKSRTVMPSADVDIVEANQPGFIVQRIVTQTSSLYSRLRKRYAKTIPFGQTAPLLVAAGTAPPAVTLVGRPVLGALLMVLELTLAGTLGTAQFRWSSDGGTTWIASGVVTAASVSLGATGMQAQFAGVGEYSTDNVYAAASPVPEAFLDWLTVLVTLDAYDKRGHNPQDPALARLATRELEVRAEVKEAADSKDGLYDLPTSEDESSAISSGGPLGASSASPYVSFSEQARRGREEDARSYRGG
ncbi:MAG TPA: hypothetical protein VIY73_28170 [Polyangiaceae bacterium]